jgi:hypothetical protein
MAEFSFIEITYDPFVNKKEKVYKSLQRIGFTHRSQHGMDFVGFWACRKCIIMLREDNINSKPKVTGLGFIGDVDDINNLDAQLDPSSDFFKVENPNGLDTYIIQENQIGRSLEMCYTSIDSLTPSHKHLQHISGIKIIHNSLEMIGHYETIGFTVESDTDNYTTLLSPSKRFSILCAKHKSEKITIISDTQDVFQATAFFVANGFDLPEFTIPRESEFDAKLNWKIQTYNCKAWGNENSYTIENMLEFANADLIFRQRKNYIKIKEDTVDSYYESI